MSEQAAFEEGVWSSLGGTKSVPARGQRCVDAVVQPVKSYYRQGSDASALYRVPVSIESDDFRRPPWSRETLPGFLESWSGHPGFGCACNQSGHATQSDRGLGLRYFPSSHLVRDALKASLIAHRTELPTLADCAVRILTLETLGVLE